MKEKTLNIGKSIRKKRFLSFFTAMFIVVSALGDCLPVLADIGNINVLQLIIVEGLA